MQEYCEVESTFAPLLKCGNHGNHNAHVDYSNSITHVMKITILTIIVTGRDVMRKKDNLDLITGHIILSEMF